MKLELLHDPVMHDFVEIGVRGGISIISKRFSQANHKACRKFNPEKELKHLICRRK